MDVFEYEKGIAGNISQATILFLIKNGKIMLAMKKRGFGEGKWNGVGGKLNPGENVYEAAIRECKEEIFVTPLNIKKVGLINFLFPLVPQVKKYDQHVSVFIATEWKGTPKESEEMKPKWFLFKDIPYGDMWWDDKFWLPKILDGRLIRAAYVFGKNDEVIDSYLNEVDEII